MHVWTRCPLFVGSLVALLSLGVPANSLADDNRGKTTETPVKSGETAVPKAGLTERELWLLERVEQLEKRVAELEAKQPATPAEGANVNTAHPIPPPPASSEPVQPASAVTVGPQTTQTSTAMAMVGAHGSLIFANRQHHCHHGEILAAGADCAVTERALSAMLAAMPTLMGK